MTREALNSPGTERDRRSPGDRRSPRQAVILTALLWPACALGWFVGAVVGLIAGALIDTTGGWAAIGWGFVGGIVGVALGGLILGWIWAIACQRRRALPVLGLLLLPGTGAAFALPLIIAVPGTGNDAYRVVVSVAILLVVTALVFLIGRHTRFRELRSDRPAQG